MNTSYLVCILVPVRTGVIYGLVDPARPAVVRYVGKTVMRPSTRMSHHLAHARKKSNGSAVGKWIRSLDGRGRLAEMVILVADVPEDRLNDEERRLIADLCPDLNLTPGGDGGYNDGLARHNAKPWTPERRAEHSERMRRYYEENPHPGTGSAQASRWHDDPEKRAAASEKIAEAQRRVWASRSEEERRAVLHDPQRLARLSESQRVRYLDPEERKKTGDAVRKSMTPEVRARIASSMREYRRRERESRGESNT